MIYSIEQTHCMAIMCQKSQSSGKKSCSFMGCCLETERILALLKRELIKQTDNFEAGIMPLTYSQLSVCPAAQTVYKSGITKYAEKKFDRNVLDDMRLSLELLVKQILGNGKSLENQTSELGTKLSGYHTEIRNLVIKTVDYLCKYQNHYVKHNDAVNPEEIDYIIEQTSATINFLIKVK